VAAGYNERYVAFLDVLGFSELVKDAGSSMEDIDTIRGIIKALRETPKPYPAADFRFTQFSDSIVLSATRDENGLVIMFEAAIRLATQMLIRGVLLRGGIAVGNISHTDDALFGVGLLNAYQYDFQGDPPRIRLSKEIREDATKFEFFPTKWPIAIRIDPFDLTDTLHTLLFFQTFREGITGPLTPQSITSIRSEIDTKARDMRFRPGVRAKWRWLRQYWNETADLNPELGRIA
jgi:hypothetical protein